MTLRNPVEEDNSTVDAVITGMKNLDVSCNICKHLNKNGFSCKAFPEVIPYVILGGEVRHTKPLFSQKNQVVFEKKTKAI